MLPVITFILSCFKHIQNINITPSNSLYISLSRVSSSHLAADVDLLCIKKKAYARVMITIPIHIKNVSSSAGWLPPSTHLTSCSATRSVRLLMFSASLT
jgi:hypothetical protein